MWLSTTEIIRKNKCSQDVFRRSCRVEDVATTNLWLFFVSANLRMIKLEREQLCEQEIRARLHSPPNTTLHN